MTTIRSALIALPLALLAGACSSSFEDRYHAALPVDQRLPIEVKSEVALLDVSTDAKGRLTPQARQQVSSFFANYRADGGQAVEIQTSVGGRVAAQAEAEIREIATIYGIPRNLIASSGYQPEAGARTTTRVAYARYVASVPSCENADWSQNLSMTWDNTTYPTFGCSLQQNLAAMASNPRDLLDAREMDPNSYGKRRDTVLDNYAKGESTAAQRTQGDSGKVADVNSGTERK